MLSRSSPPKYQPFSPGQVLGDRHCLRQPLGPLRSGKQTWQAWDLASHPYGFLWRWSGLNTLKLLLFRRTPQLVTVKLLAFHPQMQWSEFKLFEREAMVLQQLEHPRIPRYTDSLQWQAPDGNTWCGLVQAFVPGQSLQAWVKDAGTLNESQVKALAEQGLEILQYLHDSAEPILHRDIKPSNLILDSEGQLHVIDFGAVQTPESAAGLTLTIVGSLGYTPLEQYWGKAVPASDLYSLGMSLWFALTGRSPEGEFEQPEKRLANLSLSPRFAAWLSRLIQPQVADRFASAQEALTQLRQLQISPRSSSLVSSLKALATGKSDCWQLQEAPEQLTLTIQTGRSSPSLAATVSSTSTHHSHRLRSGNGSGDLLQKIAWLTLGVGSGLEVIHSSLSPLWSFPLNASWGWGTITVGSVLLITDGVKRWGRRCQFSVVGEQFTVTQSFLGRSFKSWSGDRREIVAILAQPVKPNQEQSPYKVILVTQQQIIPLASGLAKAEAEQMAIALQPLGKVMPLPS